MKRPLTLLRVARHEARVLLAERTLWIAALLLVVIVGYGAINGISWVRGRRATLQTVADEETRRISELAARLKSLELSPGTRISPFNDPRSPATIGASLGVRHATLPPGPLAALAIGQSDILPDYIKVTIQDRQSLTKNEEIENPSHLLSGRCDLGFVIVTIYPLVILALGYNLLSSEREGGTLPLLLSQAVRLRTIVLGKVAARALIIVSPAMLLAIAGILLDPRPSHGSDVSIRWLCWLTIVVTYGSLWFAIAAAVNTLGQSSSANAIIMVAAWLAIVLVIPSLVSLTASAWYPVPSRVMLLHASREAAIQANELGNHLLPAFYRAHPELTNGGTAAVDESTMRSYVIQDSIERSIEPVLRRFDGQLERQRAVISLARFLSPAILAQEAIQDVAGSGPIRHARFLAQVDEFHRRWRAYFLPRIFRKEKLTAVDFDQLPWFQFHEEETSAVVNRVAVAVGGILLPAFVIAGLGVWGLTKFSVTESHASS